MMSTKSNLVSFREFFNNIVHAYIYAGVVVEVIASLSEHAANNFSNW